MSNLLQSIKNFKNKYRKLILMLADIILISVCYLFTWSALMGRISLHAYFPTLIISWGIYAVIFFIVFLLSGMYESLWRYAEAHEFFKCCVATLISSALFVVITLLLLRPPLVAYRVPYSIYLLSALISGMSTLIMRMAYRAYKTTTQGGKISSNAQKTMIVGAGYTANQIIQDINRAAESKYEVVCMVDDDPNKMNRTIQKIHVSGKCVDIPKLVERHGIQVIILAIPGATTKQRKRIVNICAKTKCQLKKVPDLYEFVTDTTDIISQLHSVSVEDLLGRDVINVGKNPAAYLHDKAVMVTGGGGSIGSELCRQIAAQHPKKLIIVDIYENSAYDIQQELVRQYGDKLNLHTEIASVRDTRKMDKLFNKYRPEVVYHAAAHKHVPLMETAPEEAVKNNIFGTLNTARCASKYGVKRFVMISTDKAVNPTNIMGATKRTCEMIIQCMDQISNTEFVAVRFGNVLGSNGSVIPLFKNQIEAGGPVTVTHPDIIRYFMTIPEAVSLVLTAGEMARGGEIFVLDMGEPVKILELAENLIRLSGLEPYKDIQIEFSGLRPGEKLYEELLMGEEGLKKTTNEKIFVGEPIDISPSYLFNFLDKFKPIAYGNETAEVVRNLHELVPTFVVKTAEKEAVNNKR
ncbi:MAG: nucleoside-diphosphate sugar epimerase/dehydratase [Hydrogenoanaerobacterium sp.]